MAADVTNEGATTTRRRPKRRAVWMLAIAIVLGWLVLAGIQVTRGASSADSGADALRGVSALSSDDLATFVDEIDEELGSSGPSLRTKLTSAADHFGDAADHFTSPVLIPLQYTPFVGRQLRAADGLTRSAEETARVTSAGIDSITAMDRGEGSGPANRARVARSVEDALARLSSDLRDISVSDERALVGPLARAHDEFDAEHENLIAKVDDALVAVKGIASMLEGPSRYLVFAANNSEMRAGSGMFLQVGTMDITDGQFTLGGFEPTGDLFLDAPGARVDEDVAALWDDLRPSQEWRNLNLTPRFDETARMASEMWLSSGRGPADGVLAVDVIGLRSLLEAVGPVTVELDGTVRMIDADNVANELLLRQYQAFGADTPERRELLGRVASAAFDAFNTADLSATELLSALQRAGAGRHLLLWSSDPDQQAAWEVLGMSGTVPENALMLSVLNRAGNKLDQFLEVDADLEAEPTKDGNRVAVTATFRNIAPQGLPVYVDGPFPGSDFAAGEYYGFVTLTVPAGAGDPALDGGTIIRGGSDGAAAVVVAPLRLASGQETTMTFTFDLGDAWTTIDVLPSTRVPAISWTAGTESWEDGDSRLVTLADLDR